MKSDTIVTPNIDNLSHIFKMFESEIMSGNTDYVVNLLDSIEIN